MNNLYLMMYTEINLVCILLLIYVSMKAYNNIERRQSWRYYRSTLYCFIALNLSDLLWQCADYRLFPVNYTIIYFIYSMYFIFGTLVTIMWLFYVEDEMNTGVIQNRWVRFLLFSPFLLMQALLIGGYSKGYIFSLDENFAYVRGPFILLPFIIPIVYFTAACLHAAIRAFRKQNYANRQTCVTLACVSFVVTLACIIQLLVYGTPIQCIGTTTAMLMVYLTAQEQQVTLDPLTRINSRHQMECYLASRLEHTTSRSLYLMIADLDDFKNINDTFGHNEGDQALIRMADALKATAKAFHCFVARYGGDEFVLIHETGDKQEMDRVSDYLAQKLDESNSAAKAGYDLKFSFGCAQRTDDILYAPDLIAAADGSLYEIKRSKKK